MIKHAIDLFNNNHFNKRVLLGLDKWFSLGQFFLLIKQKVYDSPINDLFIYILGNNYLLYLINSISSVKNIM